MANSKLLWPTQDEERQRQELMGEMMQARGVDVTAVSRVDGGLALLEATTKCGFARMKRPAATGSPVKRGRRRNFVPMTRSTGSKKRD